MSRFPAVTREMPVPDMRLELLVDSTEFWPRLREDIFSARHSVRVQTYTFEGDRAGKMLADALLSIRPVDVKILIDSWSKLVLSDRFLYWPQNMFDTGLRREALETRQMVDRLRRAGIRVRYTNPVGPFLLKLPNRNHKKLVLIDDRSVSQFLRTDFDHTMNGGAVSMGSRSFGDIDIHVTNGKLNGGQFAKIFKVIEGAGNLISSVMGTIRKFSS